MPNEAPLGPSDGKGWTWEQALNLFQDGATYPVVPPRSTILNAKWLKADAYRKPRGPANRYPQNNWVVEWQTAGTSFYGVADSNEALEKPMADFYGNTRKILESLGRGDNTVAQPRTFDTAYGALFGAGTVLSTYGKDLKAWPEKVGHKGDDFQGGGALAFRQVLDGLVFRFQDTVDQLTVRNHLAWKSLEEAKGGTDNPATTENEGKNGLVLAIAKLQEGYEKWTERRTAPLVDTGRFGQITWNSKDLSMPAGAFTALWMSDRFQQDLNSGNPNTRATAEWNNYFPRSSQLNADVTQAAFWDQLEEIAKNMWSQHMAATLDVAAAAAVEILQASYVAAADLLPTIEKRQKLNLTTPPAVDPKKDPTKDDPTKTPPKSDLDKKPPTVDPPKIDPTENGPNGDGITPPGTDKGSGDKGGKDVPPPVPVPRPPTTNLPSNPTTRDPNSLIKVPTGSHVGPDGTVLGPDGKPVLDPTGRPIVVPPGSRVNHDGEIVGPKGEKLTEKDRLSRADPTTPGVDRESELDKYLASLRGPGAPSLPTLLTPLSPSASTPSGGSLNLGSGYTGTTSPSGTSPGATTPAPPTPKTVPTEGGPSLLKGGGTGNGTGNGQGGVPFYPPTAGGGGTGGADQNKGERDRTTWLAEDEETWGTDPRVGPSVLGRRRRGRPSVTTTARNHGQGGSDGRLAGGAAAPGHGHAEGSA
ncbi:hypothetical protein [Actinosynnema sp. NPDC020468]|uniref:hypothetical protein n=1 Tax=Actinosynnema sp. NPDC020468 TaxID=3154488 RepID=UPI0033EFFCBF